MIMLRVGIQLKPPLLQTYISPSGPSAAPFGPPGICATTSLRPSGQTRVSRCPRISTSTTEPSGISTGPSGNSRSVASTRTLGIESPRFFLGAGGIPRSSRTRNHFVAPCYGKVAIACQAITGPFGRAGQPRATAGADLSLFPDRHPDLQSAIAGDRIEFLVIALEVGRIRGLQAGRRQPVVPDRVDGAANGRDVVAMGEDRVALLGNPDPCELARQIREVGDFDACDIVEISGIVAVAADTIGDVADPCGNVRHRLMKAPPLAGNAGAVLLADALAEAGHEQRLAGVETRRLKIVR